MTNVTTSRPLDHDDACEGEPASCQCAVREVGWVAREARELADAMPEPDSPERGAWEVRRDAFCTRKRVLLAYAETMRAVRG